jgi:hypothetical protein
MEEYNDNVYNETNVREIASFIDNEYFYESIKEQINDGLYCNNVDYLSELNIKIEQLKEKYDVADYNDVLVFRDTLCKDIIDMIEGKYEVEISYNHEDPTIVAYQVYQFFVLEMKDIITSYCIYYITENYKSIIMDIPVEKLQSQISEKLKDEDDKDAYLTVSNIEEIVTQISYMDFDFETFTRYASRSGDIESLKRLVVTDTTDPDQVVSYTDTDYVPDSAFTIVEDSELVQNLLRQVSQGEYDRSIILNITDTLMTNFNIKNKLEEEMQSNGKKS